MNKHSNNCLCERYVTDGGDLTRNFDSKEYNDFFVTKVCRKSEKVNSSTSETIEYLGLQINAGEMK